jgi:twitching motility protein PilT
MITLNDALMDVVDKKLVEPAEAYMKAADKSGLEAMLKARGHDMSFLKTMQA